MCCLRTTKRLGRSPPGADFPAYQQQTMTRQYLRIDIPTRGPGDSAPAPLCL